MQRMQVNEIICGPAKEVLQALADESINCCISSPPYWALRDYGVDGQLGLEPTFEEYIDKLCTIYDEVKRVLRKDGTCWVNLGDTYNNAPSGKNPGGFQGKAMRNNPAYNTAQTRQKRNIKYPIKSLCLIPQRFAIEMVNRGWILRNVIIWHKPNPMPSSAKDKFTVDFEYVYFFVKNNQNLWYFRPDGKVSDRQPDYKSGIEGLDWYWGIRKKKRVKLSLWQGFKYWFEPQYEPQSETSHPRYARGLTEPPPADPDSKELSRPGYESWREKTPVHILPLGRNKRTVWTIPNDGGLCIEDPKIIAEFTEWLKARYPQQHAVWTIPTQSFPEAHFATFPEKLVEPMIKAGCPEFICTKCGKAREKIYDREVVHNRPNTRPDANVRPDNYERIPSDWKPKESKCLGYTDCGCNADWRPGVVWDPFVGSGTTLQVAARLGRNYGGSELKQEYIEMAEKRVMQGESGIPIKEQNKGQQGLFAAD